MTHEELGRIMRDPRLCSVIKEDISATVCIADGRPFGLPFRVCIKRFRARGFLDGFLKYLIRSRARHLWNLSGRLAEKGLPVPAPVAFLNPSPGHPASYFISGVVEDAENLGTVACREDFSPGESLAAGLAATLAEWHHAGAVHGDLKWSNILFRRTGDSFRFLFVDLDQAKLHHAPDRRGISRDLERFFRYGLELGHEAWVEKVFFPRYLTAASALTIPLPELAAVMEKARETWKKKGGRKRGKACRS